MAKVERRSNLKLKRAMDEFGIPINNVHREIRCVPKEPHYKYSHRELRTRNGIDCLLHLFMCLHAQIARFMGPAWGPPGSCRSQMGSMLAPWTLLSGCIYILRMHMWVGAYSLVFRRFYLFHSQLLPNRANFVGCICSWLWEEVISSFFSLFLW